MQFEMQVGTDYSTVKFHSWNVRPSAVENILNSLHKLGGKYLREQDHWTFPSFITSQVLEEVIHNTCYVCGGLMKDDYRKKIEGTIKYNTVIRKCSSCGHSHT